MFDARSVQAQLNSVANAGLVVDGAAGPKTFVALMRRAAGGSAPIATALAVTLPAALDRYAINTPLRVRHFLAQACVETDWFKTLKEYGGPSYYARYQGRQDLGNTQPGDGVNFPGRGLLMTTGRYNYTKLAQDTGLDCVNHPELLEEPDTAVEAAVRYWDHRGINALADANDLKGVTRAVNGGLNGYTDRAMAFQRLAVLA